MSRIGKKPVTVPNGVTVTYENNVFTAKGPKGELSLTPHPAIKVNISGDTISFSRSSDESEHRALHGLVRSLVQNIMIGVSDGFAKRLEVNGVGYRFQIQGKKVVFSLGYSHPIEYTAPEGIEFKADEEKKNILIVSGIDKQVVGQVASEIRGFRKPEPYKGKGIKYEDERIKRKAGKTAAKTG